MNTFVEIGVSCINAFYIYFARVGGSRATAPFANENRKKQFSWSSKNRG
jgi:hypothetical protein